VRGVRVFVIVIDAHHENVMLIGVLTCGCPCNGVKNETTHLLCLKHELQIEKDFCSICYVESLGEAPCVLVPL
jgi:hypothetical protein